MEFNLDNVIKFYTRWNEGKYPKAWRFGQAFVNIFGVENCYKHPQHQIGTCMFYEPNNLVVSKMILQGLQDKENTTVSDADQSNFEGV